MRTIGGIVNYLKQKLTIGQKKKLRAFLNIVDLWICKILSYKFIIVLGCQRSGTTLLYMLLTSHPLITGKDESECDFCFPTKRELLSNYIKGKMTCFKLPTKTPELNLILRKFPFAKILWITRNPLNVISSMKSLIMKKKGENWLRAVGVNELKRASKLFPEVNDINLESMDQVALGAYIWKYKNMTCIKYQQSKLKTFVLRYEDLVKDPKNVLSPILKNMGLSWDYRILQHEKIHKDNRYYGGNIGCKPLDKSRAGAEVNLNSAEIEIINNIIKNGHVLGKVAVQEGEHGE